MRIALCQINPTVGDLDANAATIARFADEARRGGADLALFPELCLTGYPPRDLLLQQGFLEETVGIARRLGEEHSAGLTLVFGTPLPADESGPARPGGGGGIHNSLLAYRDGVMLDYYDKRLLPSYDVFDEDRYFTPGDRASVITTSDVPVGLSICEDLWRGEDVGFSSRYARLPDPVEALARAGASIILNPSASPFFVGKGKRHRDLLRRHAVERRVWIAAVNQVGANDDLIFDGHAAVFAPDGTLTAAGPGFEESCIFAEVPAAAVVPVEDPLLLAPDEEHVYRALVLGLGDYCRKTGFSRAVLGVSGGIDSALVCVLAAAALGRANVDAVAMPGPYSSPGSLADARTLCDNLGVALRTIPITDAYASLGRTMAESFASREPDVTEENLQSRIRGTVVMALSNKFGSLPLSTGNKSELAVGYCTLYGDMNGGLAVLNDLPKTRLYRLARWVNDNHARIGFARPPIPESSITKPPSAELRPNQTDQDTLPPYDVLDEIIERYVELREHPSHIASETGFDPALVARVVRMIDLAEYKRRQAPTGLKVTSVAFGVGRRMPIAQLWRPDTRV